MSTPGEYIYKDLYRNPQMSTRCEYIYKNPWREPRVSTPGEYILTAAWLTGSWVPTWAYTDVCEYILTGLHWLTLAHVL